MELCVWPGDFGLLSIDIECLQFMVASKLCAAPINIKFTTKPWLSPSDNVNYGAITHYWYMSKLYFPYHMYFLEKQKRKAQSIVQSSKRNAQQLTLDAIQLASNKYFCGNKPCSLDALIFGYLAPLLRLPLPNDRVKMHLGSCTNLVRFVESIISIYLPLPESALREQLNNQRFWEKRRADAQKGLEDGRLRREQKKNETEIAANDNSVRDTLFFAAGAITLSILFAVHTGIINFQFDETLFKGRKKII